jgi:hypothetical protein
MSVPSLKILPSSHNRMLPPNWRWERARWLREQKRYSRRGRDDSWVSMAYRFQNEWDRCDSHPAFERLRQRYPGVYSAFEFYSDEMSDTRWSIEAYLCAEATIKEISTRIGEHPESIYCYANLFFDVAGKQKHWLYMLNKVLGASIHAGLTDRKYDLLWKLLGLLRGPLFLDRFIKRDGQPTRMTSYDQGSSMARDLFKLSLENKALVAAQTVPVAYNQGLIFATYQKMEELEKANGAGAETQGAIVNSIVKMVSTFGFTIASDKPTGDEKCWDDNGRELRSSQLVERALGYDVLPSPMLLPDELAST